MSEKITNTLNQAYDLGGVQYFSSPTLRAILFNGMIDSVDDSLKREDMTMYQAKNAGKNCLCFFDQHVLLDLLNKTTLTEDLSKVVHNKQFF